MAFRDILVFLDQFAHSAVRLDVAADLAGRHGARLIGLRVEVHPHIPGAIRSALVAGALEAHDVATRADTTRIETEFRTVAEKHKILCDWWVVREGGIGRVCELARYANLTVIGQAAPDADEEFSGADLIHDLVLGSGRPVLVVPYAPLAGRCGQRIAIAWDGGREASRAVADAMPLLRRAERVAVLLGDSDDRARAGELIRGHLERNGIAADIAPVDAGAHDHDAGAALLAEVDAWNADLIVMGAYGRSRVRELVLGGATRHVLHHLPIPALMSH
jgi:nucleotide-binding universal stress UspA family protein